MIPVITIDGPSGTGKGTIMSLVAERLGWHSLDSGALYRVLGVAARRRGVALEDAEALVPIAETLSVRFSAGRVYLDESDVSTEIRTEEAGMCASKVAAHPRVRAALLDWQRRMVREPGLVADGRDMGTVVFPGAPLKIFLDASPEVRAERRYKQLKEKGLDANLAQLVVDIRERDERDRNRPVAPLRPAEDAVFVDSTSMSVAEVLDRVLEEVRRVFPEPVL
ncbi:(d)CMP kinase [Imhoffiella purpurea]|uniref:Cytidylate kinase n=1 Tax=Imhoffiella purpurea TaxID=1249627 RepID=W9VIF0_9GAMM|nr:(d)CMP kinase [Imhoffiella purpurea]EXJ16801.1 Cytidylate kinase [Imhoffiella purpurea]